MPNSEQVLTDAWVSRRDAEVLREIARRYAAMVFATCRRILREPSEAEDAARESFEALVRAHQGPESHLGAWLHRVATARALQRLKRDVRRRDVETADPTWDDIEEHIDAAVVELPDAYRIPVVAHYFEGQMHSEIARSLGVSRQTVTHRIDKGVSLARKALEKRGIAVGASALASLMATHLTEAVAVPASLTASIGQLHIGASLTGATVPVAVRRPFGRIFAAVAVLALVVLGVVLLWPGRPVEAPSITAGVASEPAESPSRSAWQSPVEPTPALTNSAVSVTPPASKLAIEGVVRAELPVRRAVTEFEIGYWVGDAPLSQPVPADRLADWHRVRDAAGRFRVELSPEHAAAPVSLAVRATGYAPAWFADVSPENSPVTVTVHPAVAVKGRVVTDGGQPVAGVTVKAVDLTQWRLGDTVTESRTDGGFELSLAPVRYGLMALHPDYSHAMSMQDLTGGQAADVTIVLERPGGIEGRVALDGQPLPNAGIGVYALARTARPDEVQSGPDGSYRVESLGPGEYFLKATADTRSISRRVVVHAGLLTRVDVEFRAGASLEGTVRWANGAPANAGVRAVVRSINGDEEFAGPVDASGQYRFEAIPAGSVILHANARAPEPGRTQHAVRTLEVHEGEAARFDVDLAEEPGSLECRFTSETPMNPGIVPPARLLWGHHSFTSSAEETLLETVAYEVRSGEPERDGLFRFDGLEPGAYTVLYFAAPSWLAPRMVSETGLVRPQTLNVNVLPNQETSVDFVLAPTDDL